MAKTWQQERAKIASLSRYTPADDAELVAARQRLRAMRLETHILEQVRAWPPLTPAQLDRLGELVATAPKATTAGGEMK